MYSVYANATFKDDKLVDDIADQLTRVFQAAPRAEYFSVGITKISEEAAKNVGFIDETYHTDETMFKVMAAIEEYGYNKESATGIIQAIQNAGILFRERVPE